MGEKPNAETEELAAATAGAATASAGAGGGGISLPTPNLGVSVDVPLGGRGSTASTRNCTRCGRPRPSFRTASTP
jgi:hypothetical protein